MGVTVVIVSCVAFHTYREMLCAKSRGHCAVPTGLDLELLILQSSNKVQDY